MDMTVVNRTTGVIVGDRIAYADTSRTRLIGLLGKRDLPAGGGIWIRPSSGIHTFLMKFPIDVVGLDRDGRVIKMWADVKPNRISIGPPKVRSVIELAAGEILAKQIEVGHILSEIAASCFPGAKECDRLS